MHLFEYFNEYLYYFIRYFLYLLWKYTHCLFGKMASLPYLKKEVISQNANFTFHEQFFFCHCTLMFFI